MRRIFLVIVKNILGVFQKGNVMKFSVIIPVFNKADTILSAIESVYAQTVTDYEIVIVDDGSSDDLNAVLNTVQSASLRILHQENRGVSAARNTGIDNATGDYVCFLDADDLWKPNHLEVLHHLIAAYPNSEVFVTSHCVQTDNGAMIHSADFLTSFAQDFETDDFLGLLNSTSYGVVHTNSVCVKRDMLQKNHIRFQEGIKIGEDTDVWYRLGLKNTVAVSKQETTQYRREFSTATRQSFHVHDWIFVSRSQEILSDSDIPDYRKQSFIALIDRYKLTSSREYMAQGDRQRAKRVLSEIQNKHGKRYLLTWLFTFMPYALCKTILRKTY